MDLVGNVWQWTDEYLDEHTRAAIVRGGSYYQPQGSMWCFPQVYKLTEHGKFLLMAPSIDRSAALGFGSRMPSDPVLNRFEPNGKLVDRVLINHQNKTNASLA